MNITLCAFADEAGSSICEQIDALQQNNIRLLELRSVDGVNVADIEIARAREIWQRLRAGGIEVFSIGSPIGKVPVDTDIDAELIRLEHILRLCEVFDCAKIRMFSFFIESGFEGHRHTVMEKLRNLTAAAKRAGVSLYHENEKGIYGDIAQRVEHIITDVEGIKTIFDPANYLQSGQDIDDAIDSLLPHAGYVHIKDVIKSTGELVPAGYGDCKIDKIALSIDRDTIMTVEPHLKLFGGYGEIDKHEMKTKFIYATQRDSFNAAVKALKGVLKKAGFEEKDGKWVRVNHIV